MELIGLILLIVGIFSLFVTIRLILKIDIFKSEFLKNESIRILSDNARVDENYTSQGRIFTRGLAVVKDKESDKFRIIAQAKPCDIGLY